MTDKAALAIRLANLKPFKKGKSGNPKGRPKRLALQLKNAGYTQAEAHATNEKLLALNAEEFKKIAANPKATMMERIFIKRIDKDLRNAEMVSIEYGYPKRQAKLQVESTVVEYKPSDDPIEASKAYQEFIRQLNERQG